jgi:uncharacterized membrane protein YuzA (DUF378 family)
VKVVLRNIKFWLLLFFVLRMVGITNPPLEASHNWRQTSGLMVARGFLEVDNNILYPRKEDHKGTTGIIGIEFPVLNYSHYLVAKIFGNTHWYSRLINLIISTLGLWFFYLILKRILNEPVAFYATLITITSVWFAYSRKTMPDTFSVALVMMGVYCGIVYLNNKKFWSWLGFFLLTTLGMLAKIPAVIYLGLLLIPVIEYGLLKKESLMVLIGSVVGLTLVYGWYFIWNEHLAYNYGIWYNRGFKLSEGLLVMKSNILNLIELFAHSALQSFIFFGCFIGGLILAVIKKNGKIFLLTLPLFIGFVIYALKSGEIFIHHIYYLVPIAPVMAIFSAYLLSQIKRKTLVIILLSIGIVEGVANQQHDFFIKDSETYKLTLESIMDEHVPKDSLIGVTSMDENHQLMYLAHRKGWMILNDQVLKTEVLADHKARGCDFLVIDKHIQPNKPLLELIFENEDFAVFKF